LASSIPVSTIFQPHSLRPWRWRLQFLRNFGVHYSITRCHSKVNVKLYLCSNKHLAMKTCVRVDAQFHHSWTWH
jgi:hypothetical protein